jgi:SRSO17 transposase
MKGVAATVAASDKEQIHNFVAGSRWNTAPLEGELARAADALVGGDEAHLIIDDTALVKKGERSVGVAHQYCGQLGKNANCQSLVSTTLARDEVPVPVGLRLFLPKSWAEDRERCRQAGVPDDIDYQPKWKIALGEIDRLLATGVRFGDVLADTEYGGCAEFRRGLTQRGLRWAVGIRASQNVYRADVKLRMPAQTSGRPRKHPKPSQQTVCISDFIASLGPKGFRRVTWRNGTKGKLAAEFAAARVRIADGPEARNGKHLPGDEVWLVCEKRSGGELRYYASNYPSGTCLRRLAWAIKARWSCEQAHQQLKQELGLNHFEGRTWSGLHHHALLTMMAMEFLQTLRCEEKKRLPDGAASNAFATAS